MIIDLTLQREAHYFCETKYYSRYVRILKGSVMDTLI